MILFAKKDTGYIIGSVWADKPEVAQTLTRIPDGCDAFYFDDATHPELQTNLGGYKIVSGYPVALTAAEIQAIADAAPPHVATTEDRVDDLREQSFALNTANQASQDTLTQLIDILSSKGLI